MRALVVVEEDEDAQLLIETVFSLDSRFTLASVSATAEGAFEMVQTKEPGTIVLDHGLAGSLTDLEAAPRFKGVAQTDVRWIWSVPSDQRVGVVTGEDPMAPEPAGSGAALSGQDPFIRPARSAESRSGGTTSLRSSAT